MFDHAKNYEIVTIFSGLHAKWLELPRIQSIESLMVASFAVPIALLSIFPHQEPRFIIPVLLPLVYLFSHVIESYLYDVNIIVDDKGEVESIKIKNKTQLENKSWVKTIWYSSNIFLAIFYGYVHQGGIVPLTSHLYKELRSKPELTHVYFLSSHSYSLPTGLLHLRNTKKTYSSSLGFKYKLKKDFYMNELGSIDAKSMNKQILKTLKSCEKKFKIKKIPYRIYYALPYSFYDEFVNYAVKNESQLYTISSVKEFYPHISTEKLPSLNFSWECLNLIGLKKCTFSFLENISDKITFFFNQFSLILLQIESA